jgi:hypothetical protein
MDLRKRKREENIPEKSKKPVYEMRSELDTRDFYDILYQHFTNYKTHYIKDDIRIDSYNREFKNNYDKKGDEFITKLMEKFIENGYNFDSKNDFIEFINYSINDMETNYLSKKKIRRSRPSYIKKRYEEYTPFSGSGLPSRLDSIFEDDEESDKDGNSKIKRKSKTRKRKSKSKRRKSKSRLRRKSKSRRRKSKSRRRK